MNKIKMIITSVFFITVMCLSTITASAAGQEVWSFGNTYTSEYTFTDTNLTPIKTISGNGVMYVSGDFWKADTGASDIGLTIQVREYPSGKILGQSYSPNPLRPNDPTYFSVAAEVYNGQRIQLWFDASSISNPPGFFRSAHVKYDCTISY